MKNVYPIKCRISAKAGEPARVDVYDDIGGGFFKDGVTAADVAGQLAGIKGPLEVHINSGGGDVFDGITIANAIRGHKGKVTTVVDGLAASIASVIAQAGQDRVAQPGSMFMIHDAFGACVGDAAEHAKMAETLDQVSDNIAAIYANRTGRDPAYWRDQMRGETWFTAEEAVEAGLADRAGDGTAELPAGLDLAAFTQVPGRIAARLRALPATATAPPAAAAAGPCCDQCGPGCGCMKPPKGDGKGKKAKAGKPQFEGAWDGDAAMARAGAADDPAAAFKSICAGRRDGDPALRQTWALPHHDKPGGPPNPDGVSAALGRIDQTQGLVNKDAALAHLKAHQGGSSGNHSHDDDLPGMTPEQFRAALRGATE